MKMTSGWSEEGASGSHVGWKALLQLRSLILYQKHQPPLNATTYDQLTSGANE